MSVGAFLAKNSVLWPLIAVVGAGVSVSVTGSMLRSFLTLSCPTCPCPLAIPLQVGGSLGFGAYYLSHNQDVVINKKIRDPWNNSECLVECKTHCQLLKYTTSLTCFVLSTLFARLRLYSTVAQDKNSKLLSYNGDFWKGRAGLPDPVRYTLPVTAVQNLADWPCLT